MDTTDIDRFAQRALRARESEMPFSDWAILSVMGGAFFTIPSGGLIESGVGRGYSVPLLLWAGVTLLAVYVLGVLVGFVWALRIAMARAWVGRLVSRPDLRSVYYYDCAPERTATDHAARCKKALTF